MNVGKQSGGERFAWRCRRWSALSLLIVGLASVFQAEAADCLPLPSGLIGWWPGDGSATNYFGTNNGTLQGGATATNSGFVAQAFRFDGTNNYVSIPDSPALRPTNLTIEAWVWFDGLNAAGTGPAAGQQYIVFKQNTRSSWFEGFYLGKERHASGDIFTFTVTSSSGQPADLNGATLIQTGAWYHVAAVRGPNFLQLYVNGLLERQTNVAFAQNYGTLPLYFGTSGQSYWDRRFKGLLDEVSLYNRALTSNEIAAIYAAGAAGKCKTTSGLAITAQPQSQSVVVGSNATFTVTASGVVPLSYRWRFNGTEIADATNTSFTLSNVQLGDAGDYTVVVTNSAGSVTSVVAVLTVLIPPVVTTQPGSLTNTTGTMAIFSATATGSAPLSYRWRQNGVPLNNGVHITGATTDTLTISNLLATDAGNYTLLVTNAAGTATSSVATLTVIGPPVITGQPANQSVVAGANANFSVSAAGTPPLGYQWRFNGTDLANATSPNLTLTNVQPGNAGNYTVVVTNPVAVLTVLVPPAITLQPQSLTNLAGTTALFSATATGSAPLSYRWLFNGATLNNGARVSGATTSSVTISNLQSADAGNYALVVTNAAGFVTSAVATLTVLSPPVINTQPASQSVLAGAGVGFNVAASGTAPLSYQWRKNGANLGNGGNVSGATSSTLTLSNVQTNDAGNYQVVLTNIAGVVTSAVASLTVNVQGGCLAPALGLVGWWPGDGDAGDIAGVAHGTLQGGATAGVGGMVGLAFNFDGTNNYVQIPDSPVLRPTNFTIETWVRFSALNSAGNASAGQQYIVFKQNTRSTYFEGFYVGKERVSNNDYFTFGVTPAAGAGADVNSSSVIQTGVWYHVAAVRGPNYIQLFVNGQLQGQATANFAQNYGTLPLYFGSSGQSYWDRKFRGTLDEVSLYNRPLSSNEIAAIYAAGTAGKCRGPAPPAIVTQPANQVYTAGGTATFTVGAVGSAPLSYQWFRDGFILNNDARISGATNATLIITALQSSDIGNYQVVVSNTLGTATSAVASLNTGVAPANNAFASATAIGGSAGSINGNNANATKQTGEPNHGGNVGGASVWYNWTAPSTSPVTFDTALSAFDTLLGVYTGNAVNALTAVAGNNNISTNNSRSRVTFTPVAGTVYHIAVDGNNGANGNLTLRWSQATTPLPDLTVFGTAVNPRIVTETFSASSCAVLEGLVPAGTRRLIRFDTQTANQGNADLIFGSPINNPGFVYAPCHAHYHFQDYMTYRLRYANGNIATLGLKVGFCILDVFRWSSSSPVNAKYTCSNQGIQVGWGDLYDSTLDGQWLDITGLPDGNYVIELEANPVGVIQESNYGNNLTQVPITIGSSSGPPLNNNFASAQTLLGSSPSVAGNNLNATKEGGEPNHAGNAGGKSVWYNWTAPTTKPVTIDTIGTGFNTLLGVYTGNSVGALSLVVSNDDIIAGTTLQSRVTFNATAGTLYRIAVDGFNGASGNIVLTANQTVANDNFAACIFTGGVGGSLSGSSVGATKETNEPNHAGNAGGHSIWFCWTAPIGGTATFDTVGSTFNTLLAVYTGNNLNALTLVAANDDIVLGSDVQSRVTFNAVGLTMYHIAIDGFAADSGNTMLNWSLSGAAFASVGRDEPNLIAGQATVADQAVLSYRFLPEGEFQLAITGLPQQRYRVERSCDLANWATLVTTVADFSGRAWFTDKAARHLQTGSGDSICGPGQVVGVALSATEARFYRAVAVPAN